MDCGGGHLALIFLCVKVGEREGEGRVLIPPMRLYKLINNLQK